MKDVDLVEPTSFLDHVFFGLHSKRVSNQQGFCGELQRYMFESRISAGAKEKLPTRASGKPDAETISSWSYDMEGHAKRCVEINCELVNKTRQQFFKAATTRSDDHQLKEADNESLGDLSTNFSEMSVFGSYWQT